MESVGLLLWEIKGWETGILPELGYTAKGPHGTSRDRNQASQVTQPHSREVGKAQCQQYEDHGHIVSAVGTQKVNS